MQEQPYQCAKYSIKMAKVLIAVIRFAAYWVALVNYFIAKQKQTGKSNVQIIIPVIIGVMIAYFILYSLVLFDWIETNTCIDSCTGCMTVAVKRAFPSMIFSTLGLAQLFIALQLYQILACQAELPKRKKMFLTLISALGSVGIMIYLIVNSINVTSPKTFRFYRIAMISGFLSIGFSVLGGLLQQLTIMANGRRQSREEGHSEPAHDGTLNEMQRDIPNDSVL